MKNKGFTIEEIFLVIAIIALISAIFIPYLLPKNKIEEYRKAQIVSIDEEGNKLWRVWDNGKFIYYLPRGETSWEVQNGKSNIKMGVK